MVPFEVERSCIPSTELSSATCVVHAVALWSLRGWPVIRRCEISDVHVDGFFIGLRARSSRWPMWWSLWRWLVGSSHAEDVEGARKGDGGINEREREILILRLGFVDRRMLYYIIGRLSGGIMITIMCDHVEWLVQFQGMGLWAIDGHIDRPKRLGCQGRSAIAAAVGASDAVFCMCRVCFFCIRTDHLHQL